MKIQIKSKQAEINEAARAQLERRLEFGLGRFSPRIHCANVQLVDINGPRGGEDKVCRIEVRLLPTGTLFVEDVGSDGYAAIDRATDRIARAVIRFIKRSRDIEREAPDGPNVRGTNQQVSPL